jgi:hypothetical protein
MNSKDIAIERFAAGRENYETVVMIGIDKNGGITHHNYATDPKDVVFAASFLSAIVMQGFIQVGPGHSPDLLDDDEE